MTARVTTWESERGRVSYASPWRAAGPLLWPLQLALAFPSVLYLGALTVFLFRPPDVDFYHADRVAFGVLVCAVALRVLMLRQRLPFVAGISWPMLGLVALAVLRACRDPFDVQTWSLVADKFIVPFTLFHVAILVFTSDAARRRFQIFIVFTLAYLVFIAVAFLAGANELIFPRFILDPGLGLHVERARGPFLQAVANGLALNLLGILAVVFVEHRKRIVLFLWLLLPLAVLATLTRAVWISFAVSFALALRIGDRRVRRAATILAIAAPFFVGGALLGSSDLVKTLRERTEESGPVSARMSVYEAGWTMFLNHPFTGWSASRMYPELARRMQGYHLRTFYPHNTYLSLLVEFGVPGLVLYAVLFFNLFRLARSPVDAQGLRSAPLGAAPLNSSLSSLRRVWPLLLGVYLFNAFFVDMAYQFVIGLVFTVAGMLCAPQEASA